LIASDGKNGDFFGSSISINGNWMAIGANGVTTSKADYTGAVYLFEFSSATNKWEEKAKLMAPDTDVTVSAIDYYYFGIDVSISGNDLVVGAYGDATAHVGDYSGAAYLYRRDTATNIWNLVRKMTRSVPTAYDRCGRTVASVDGVTLLACDGSDYNGLTDPGAALYFQN
jgi:hypothetical protein